MQWPFLDSFSESEPKSSKSFRSINSLKTRYLIEYLVEQIQLSESDAIILVRVHQCTTKAELLELLTTDENMLYSHIYIPDFTNGEVCSICKQKLEKHAFYDLELIEQALYEEKKSKTSEEQLLIENSNKEDAKTELCQICYLKFQVEEMAQFSSAYHSLCIPCFTAYINEKITSMDVQSIFCPHCNQKLTHDIIRNFASEKAFQLYEKFLENNQIQKNPNLMWCPNPKCSVVISKQKKKKIFLCPKCSLRICQKCKRQAHPGKSCDSHFKNEIKSWQNSTQIQRCKKCCSMVEKISGCNHMSCAVCGYEWCWLCGANYSDQHFNPFNPFGCAGMQNRDSISQCRIWGWRISLFLLILIIVPVAIPFALLLAGPFVAIEYSSKRIQYHQGHIRIKKFFAVIIGFVVGIVFNPVFWIGLIIIFAPKFIGGVRQYFRNRRRRQQIAENRITERLLNDAIENTQNIVVFEN